MEQQKQARSEAWGHRVSAWVGAASCLPSHRVCTWDRTARCLLSRRVGIWNKTANCLPCHRFGVRDGAVSYLPSHRVGAWERAATCLLSNISTLLSCHSAKGMQSQRLSQMRAQPKTVCAATHMLHVA